MRQKEREELVKEEDEYEERMRQRRMRDREKAYKMVSLAEDMLPPPIPLIRSPF